MPRKTRVLGTLDGAKKLTWKALKRAAELLEAGDWLEAAGKGLPFPEEVRVWWPGKPPTTATGWKEAQDALGVRVGVDYF